MDIKEIQALIKFVAKSRVSEVDLKTDTIQIRIKTIPDTKIIQEPFVQQATAQQTPAQVTALSAIEEKKESLEKKEDTPNYVAVKSPMIGTFYRKSAPDKSEFVKVGDQISVGQVVCVIEAMKLFNEIESEISGKIVKVLVDDSSPVEYDQSLFLVDPS